MPETTSTRRPSGPIDQREIFYNQSKPNRLNHEEWVELRNFTIATWEGVFPNRTRAEIHHLAGTRTLPDFVDGKVSPETRFPGQSFANEKIIRAFHRSRLVGALAVADNTSSSSEFGPFNWLERQAKMLTPAGLPIPKTGGKKYAFLPEALVAPRYRRNDIGAVMLALALQGRDESQIATAYIWPELRSDMIPILGSIGMKPDVDTTHEQIFGPGSEPVEQQRWTGSVGTIRAFQLASAGTPA